ncbi:Reverse transcriptase zinc-binding domain [Macleaya cordata]|uniref:Reverse transcriptase zinc-binding domain n=1 Tax=Macleaya cordata TaxID=56857 RepID=A0A200RAS2_MACCD|nr:Reverse transcriptase zinc-binding domain [Macleaya cordata]
MEVFNSTGLMLGSIVNAKYLKLESYWTEKKYHNVSPIWRSLCAVRSSMKEAVCWAVGTGHEIKIWSDPWVPYLPDFRVEGLPGAQRKIYRVADLICQHSRMWKVDLVHEYFTPHEARAILSIQLPMDAIAGRLLWLKTPTSQFSSKSAHTMLTQNAPSSSSSPKINPAFHWKALWQLQGISPRVQIFLWRVITNSIPLKSRLAQFVSSIDNCCPLCHFSPETTDHLFLKREVVQLVWFGFPISLHVDMNNNDFTLEYIFKGWLSQPSSFEAAKMGCAIIWSIWKSRNRAVFDSWKFDPKEVITNALHVYNEHLVDACISPTLPQTNTQVGLVEASAHWSRPPEGYIKINVDGATWKNSIAVGLVVRNELGMYWLVDLSLMKISLGRMLLLRQKQELS